MSLADFWATLFSIPEPSTVSIFLHVWDFCTFGMNGTLKNKMVRFESHLVDFDGFWLFPSMFPVLSEFRLFSHSNSAVW